MDTEPDNVKKEEVERLPANDSDLENGTSDRGVATHGRNGSGENMNLQTPLTINSTNTSSAHADRHSSATSSDPEKRDDIEVVDWDGPNDPENPYGCLSRLALSLGTY